MSGVRETLEAYERLLGRAVEISEIPGFHFDTECFCVRVSDDDDALVDIQMFEIDPGFYDDPASIRSDYKTITIELFEMSDEDFAQRKRELIDEHEKRRQQREHEKAMAEVAGREAKERAEFKRLKAKFGGAS